MTIRREVVTGFALCADKIFKGARLAWLRRIAIPQSILLRVDKVIE